jgi:membrane-associated phospholipid phosphatase
MEIKQFATLDPELEALASQIKPLPADICDSALEQASNAPAETSRSGFIGAAKDIGKLAVLGAVLLILVAVRTEGGVVAGIGLMAGAVFGVYIAFGKRQGMSALLVYLLGFALFAQLRAFGDETGIAHSYTYVISADAVFGANPSAWLQDHLYSAGSYGLLDYGTAVVYVSYFVVLHIVAFYLWSRRRELFGLYAGALLLCFYTGLLASFLLPTAPPWLASQHGDIGNVARIFQEMVGTGTHSSAGAAVGQNDVAAMPSLHMAITVVVAIFTWHCNRRLGVLGAVYAASMGFTLVYMGEHYVVDVLAGVAFAAGSWVVALRLWRKRAEVAPEGPIGRVVIPALQGQMARH